MQIEPHDIQSLFAQLGLPYEAAAIDAYIAAHSPLAPHLALADAPFWSASQAQFLREELLVDADWAAAIDDLNVQLR
jgi:hypothetical protein